MDGYGLWPKQVVSIKPKFILNKAGSSVVLLAPDTPHVSVTYLLLYVEVTLGIFEGNLHNSFLFFLLIFFILSDHQIQPWPIL